MKGIRAAVVSALLAVGAIAQVTSQPQASQPIHRAVNEVMVDLVVTGSHGRIIKHLKPSQIELFDNGRRRAITSFRRVSRSVHLSVTTLRRFGLGRLPRNQRPQPFNLIFLVFGHVTSLGRSLARQSALWFLQHDFAAGDYGAVLDASAGLRALTPITTNRAVLERAVERASGGGSAGRQNVLTAEQAIYHGAGGPDQAMPEAERMQSSQFGATYPAGGTGAAAAAGASALGSAAMQAALAAVINHSAAAANAASSWSSLTALRALDRALGLLRGRKEVVYYTQWLDVNPTTVFLFRAVMHDANRYHVSFYPVDPAGLTPTSSNDQVANALLRAAHAAATSQMSYYHTAAGNIENVAYAGRLSSLRELAAATGGFVAARTNDLNPFMTKIADDIHDHYELTYNPGRLGATGAFHAITIRIPGHPHWRVRARKGYYVLPRLPSPLPDRLDPLVAALYARQPPRDLGLATRAFVFPRAAGGSHLWLAAQVPLGDLPAAPLPPAMLKQHPQFRGRQLVQFALLGAVEDRQRRIVADAGKEFGFAVAAARQAHATVPRWAGHWTLSPGAYTVRTVLYQPEMRQTSELAFPLVVRAAPVRLSTVALVQGVRPAPASSAAVDPWRYQHAEIVPNLSGTLAASQNPKLTIGFYFLAAVPPGTKGATVRIRFARGGKIFRRSPPFPLPKPDSQGRIRFLAHVPIRIFPPGAYTATVIVLAAGHAAAAVTEFRVVQP